MRIIVTTRLSLSDKYDKDLLGKEFIFLIFDSTSLSQLDTLVHH